MVKAQYSTDSFIGLMLIARKTCYICGVCHNIRPCQCCNTRFILKRLLSFLKLNEIAF